MNSFRHANYQSKTEPAGESKCTCMELIIVLSANTVAESLSVDWLSNVPCVSINKTATCEMKQTSKLTCTITQT